MRPLEKSLEKLDDVRRKKLSEIIGVSGGGPPSGPTSGLQIYNYFVINTILYTFYSFHSCFSV